MIIHDKTGLTNGKQPEECFTRCLAVAPTLVILTPSKP